MSDSAIFLVIVSAWFLLCARFSSWPMWLIFIVFGYFLEWWRTVPQAIHQVNVEGDGWYLLGIWVLMFALIYQVETLWSAWRIRMNRNSQGAFSGSQSGQTSSQSGTEL